MQIIEFKGIKFPVDLEGFLLDYNLWGPIWVEMVAMQEGVTITKEHEKVIEVLRNYYQENGIAPMVRILTRLTGYCLEYIYKLFPSGPGKGACKMAGLPKPFGCV